jgi:uncharacterized protein YybS (DUF2232 family)
VYGKAVYMANSPLRIDKKAFLEVALMAALTAVMGMASIFVPFIEPVLSMVWALPVVAVCLRRGMGAGFVTIAASGAIIAVFTMPELAADMLTRSAPPALLLGYGFLRKWKSETAVFATTIAAIAGFAAAFALSAFVFGIDLEEFFMLQPAMVDDVVAMFMEYMPAGGQGFISPAELRQLVEKSFDMARYLLPSIIVVLSLVSSLLNYAAANFILGKFKAQLPPVAKLDTFRLPFGVIFAFILGYGLHVSVGAFWPDGDAFMKFGQNLMLVTHALYFFQGMGLILHYMRKAPQGIRVFWRILLVLTVLWTQVFFLLGVGYIGVADALFDFRRIGSWVKEES